MLEGRQEEQAGTDIFCQQPEFPAVELLTMRVTQRLLAEALCSVLPHSVLCSPAGEQSLAIGNAVRGTVVSVCRNPWKGWFYLAKSTSTSAASFVLC